jgi:hypothetical protein
MSADLHLYVLTGSGRDVEEYIRARRYEDEHIFDPAVVGTLISTQETVNRLVTKVTNNYRNDNIWIGEVSWLKGALTGDEERYIPTPVQAVVNVFQHEDYKGFPVVDAELIVRVHKAMKQENTTAYSVADPDEVAKWLGEHIGCRLSHETL